jgi:Protein of unknown function (DUF2958)
LTILIRFIYQQGFVMELLTAEIRALLPAIYAQEKIADPIVYVKFFTPDSNWTWYGTEFDGEDTFFGLVQGFEQELGYFSLSELQEYRGALGIGIERDLHFNPTPLSHLRCKQKNQPQATNTNISTDGDIITYEFSDADRKDPTEFFNFITGLLGDD